MWFKNNSEQSNISFATGGWVCPNMSTTYLPFASLLLLGSATLTLACADCWNWHRSPFAQRSQQQHHSKVETEKHQSLLVRGFLVPSSILVFKVWFPRTLCFSMYFDHFFSQSLSLFCFFFGSLIICWVRFNLCLLRCLCFFLLPVFSSLWNTLYFGLVNLLIFVW